MSDYLHRLVARTLSPEACLRPQLRSSFEPAPLRGGLTLPADFEWETRVELNPGASPPLAAPFESVPSREPPDSAPTISPKGDESPRQVVPPPTPPSIRSHRRPLNSNENENTATDQPPQLIDREPSMKSTALQRVMHPSPDSAFENSQVVPTPAATQRRESVPAPRPEPPAQIFETVHPAARMVPQAVESEETPSERIGLVAIRSVLPAATILSSNRSVAPTSDTPGTAAEPIRSQPFESEEPRSERRRTVGSEERRSVRFAVSAIRPVAQAALVYSPSPAPAVPPPPPAIHVTIGRVEVRATPPPSAGHQTKPTLPPVMSLDDYLARRASGGKR